MHVVYGKFSFLSIARVHNTTHVRCVLRSESGKLRNDRKGSGLCCVSDLLSCVYCCYYFYFYYYFFGWENVCYKCVCVCEWESFPFHLGMLIKFSLFSVNWARYVNSDGKENHWTFSYRVKIFTFLDCKTALKTEKGVNWRKIVTKVKYFTRESDLEECPIFSCTNPVNRPNR